MSVEKEDKLNMAVTGEPEAETQSPMVGRLPVVNNSCQRCGSRVYQMEKIGPVNGVLFHRQCFTCHSCGQHLTLRTYYTNQNNALDKDVYCVSHYPRASAHGFDAQAVCIRSALSAPYRGLEQNGLIRGTGEVPRVGFDALHIQTPLTSQTHFDRKCVPKHDKYHFPASLVNLRNEKLYRSQKRLELLQRREEDRLMESFRLKRQQEAMTMRQGVDDEWQKRLHELMDKYSKNRKHKKVKDDKLASEGYELEREALRATMTMKMQKKKEALSLKLVQEQQRQTSILIQKHSRQMLSLISSNDEQLRDELELEISTASEQEIDDKLRMLESLLSGSVASLLPPPHPPPCRKRDFYFDPGVFIDIDRDVFMVAETEQSTFTDLVKQLTNRCQNDLEIARAIFRWITVKNLNVMEFDETIEQDTPLGILRGIKYGTETYHTLFLRLCSFAGLPCVEIHGHSKSVGYEPGLKIESGDFLNTWNAVLIDGHWWPVQCNWGARHLVQNKDLKVKSRLDQIHYEYDEHYFLTDPDEFIQEFWAFDKPWQLLERSICLEEFEDLPFVRSIFFHCDLEFQATPAAILVTDSMGGTQVRINVPEERRKEIVFHYQLRLVDSVSNGNDLEYNGEKLERYVFHALEDSSALFSVHVPAVGSYHLEIFTNRIQGGRSNGDDLDTTSSTAGIPPFRLKCSCKFRIVCPQLTSGRMQPLPECSSGEWGPAKALRNFRIEPITHQNGVIDVGEDLVEIGLRFSTQLQFLCRLRANGMTPEILDRQVEVKKLTGSTVAVRVILPVPGQYGVDIFVRCDDQSLHHACKYLINRSRVVGPTREFGAFLCRDYPLRQHPDGSTVYPKCWGPTPAFENFGLRAVSHPNPNIELRTSGSLSIVVGLEKPVKLFGILRERSNPGEVLTDRVTTKEHGSSKKIKFTFDISDSESNGSYAFEIFAKMADEPVNVYNYVINKLSGDVITRRNYKGLFSL